jgi:hypothetical protein
MATTLSLPGISGLYALGLKWRHEDFVPKAGALRARSLEEGRWGLVRKTSAGAVQAAFCEPIEGIARPQSVKALAGLVADSRPQPWMGIYDLGDGRHWYIAVRDSQEVLPDGDFVGTLSEVMSVRDRHFDEKADWKEDFDGKIEDLIEVVMSTPQQPHLRDLQSRPWLVPSIAAGAFLAAGVIGAACLLVHQRGEAEKRRVALARAREVQAALKARLDGTTKFPWMRQPTSSLFLDACRRAWDPQSLSAKGWVLSSWQCAVTSGGLSIEKTWDRGGASAADAPGELSADGQRSLQDDRVPVNFAESSALAAMEQPARRAVWALAQNNGLGLKLADERPATRSLPGAASAEPSKAVPEPWTTFAATFVSSAPLWTYGAHHGQQVAAEQFDAVPGMRIEGVRWESKSGLWTNTGHLYVLRPQGVAVQGSLK